jgi:hypothetical protein
MRIKPLKCMEMHRKELKFAPVVAPVNDHSIPWVSFSTGAPARITGAKLELHRVEEK